ncbi:MAG: Protease HtpX-like protein [Parcubacteria group bacterium GW2011_GWC2_39_11]|nr:MAG: Protease HtpX-like protein [Parcubacteria group bacterium GW2011_GWA2_38_27]KKQ97120.1 MAG: Protease HtpX-like protein [Parcubacteria group bacterium GW2011_GWC2_39_11]
MLLSDNNTIIMTLYNQADSNIRKTWFYVTGFLVLVIFFGWLASYYLNSYAILWIAVIYSISASFISYWYSDKIVMAITKAQPIAREDNAELYRLVENLCITAGLPLPKIYILNEAQPNAFATGRDPEHAAIAVTIGLMNRLERTELEGVIAHELSHIGNRDALLQTAVVVLTGVVVIVADLFVRFSIFGGGFGGRRNSRDGGNAGAIFLLIALLFSILAPLAATLIKLAISRKREFLADADGALLTRYPDGLARALEKISSDQSPLRVANNSTAHLFIASPFKSGQRQNWVSKLFMTHPPIEERVAALRGMNM